MLKSYLYQARIVLEVGKTSNNYYHLHDNIVYSRSVIRRVSFIYKSPTEYAIDIHQSEYPDIPFTRQKTPFGYMYVTKGFSVAVPDDLTYVPIKSIILNAKVIPKAKRYSFRKPDSCIYIPDKQSELLVSEEVSSFSHQVLMSDTQMNRLFSAKDEKEQIGLLNLKYINKSTSRKRALEALAIAESLHNLKGVIPNDSFTELADTCCLK